MSRMLIFLGITLGGYLGWVAGEAVGLEFLGCFLASGAGSLIGVYAGWKSAQRFR